MMLGQPVADIAERVRVARQIDAVAQRCRGLGAGSDDGQVEDGERNHCPYLVHGIRPTKGPGAQIRRAGKAERWLSKRGSWDTKYVTAKTSTMPTLISGCVFASRAQITIYFRILVVFAGPEANR